MCFKGNCDVTNEAEQFSTVMRSKGGVGEGGRGNGSGWVDWVLMWRRKVRGGTSPWKPTAVLVKRLL